MLSVTIIWEEFLKIIKEEAGSQVVETWFKTVSLQSWDAITCTATLLMPNQFVKNWIQQHYTELLKTHLARLLNAQSITFVFTYANGLSVASPEQKEPIMVLPATILQKPSPAWLSPQQPPRPLSTPSLISKTTDEYEQKKKHSQSLNPAYTFESFVAGPSNSLAHGAAYAVAQNLAHAYNPLFIYGATGLGKTHLLHAIGNEIKRKNPSLVVRYETADKFMNDFIHSIRFDKSHQFRDRYKKIDLLLVDDVQFFSNKQQTQETFFHIFNTLYGQGKQIILSSDTFPKEIAGLQNRLKSRMEWGLVVDIQIPDLETKIAILRKKAEAHDLPINDDIAHYIASRVLSNIRELEGSLIRVGAFASLTQQPLTVELAKRVLLHPAEEKKDGIMLNKILATVGKMYGVSVSNIRSKKRHKDIASIRQVVFYLMKKLTFCSLQAIGAFIGGRDHSTVIHAINKIEELKKHDSTFAQKLKAIEQDILSN